MSSAHEAPRDAEAIALRLADIAVQLRRIADTLALLAPDAETPARREAASRPARPYRDHARRARGDERRKTTPQTRSCAACGEAFTPTRGFEKRCDDCFRSSREAKPDGATDPPPHGPF